MGSRVQGPRPRVQGPGPRVQGPGSRVQGPGARVQGLVFRINCSYGLRFKFRFWFRRSLRFCERRRHPAGQNRKHVQSGDTTPCRMTGVTFQQLSPGSRGPLAAGDPWAKESLAYTLNPTPYTANPPEGSHLALVSEMLTGGEYCQHFCVKLPISKLTIGVAIS